MSKVGKILLSIPVSLMFLVVFYGSYVLIALAISLVLLLLSYIPLVNLIVDFLFLARGDDPSVLAIFAGTVFAYTIGNIVLEKIRIRALTLKSTFLVSGAFLILYNVTNFIIRIFTGGSLLGLLAHAIAGLIIFYKGIMHYSSND